jgi:hypothetical protein
MSDHQRLSRVLRQQFGVVRREQLVESGVSARSVRRACAAGSYVVVLPGVLHSFGHPVTFESRAMAVQLYVGSGGALSGPTAGRLYGLRSMPDERIWASTSRSSRARLPTWFVPTTSPWLLDCPGAVRQLGCWRVLAPAPMLLTLAELFNDHRFERAAEDAWHLKLLTPQSAAVFLDEQRGSGRRGVARFDRWLGHARARQRPSQSGFEVDVIDALRGAGLPEPTRQHPVMLRTGEVVHLDIAWPDVMLAVEPGHSWWHGGDIRTRADQARDRACGLVGWHVMRYDEAARADLAGLAAEVAEMHHQRDAVNSR